MTRARGHATNPQRRAIIHMLLLGGACAAVPALDAQEATRPLRIVVPTPPAGNLDFVARLLAEKLSPGLQQAVLVENRAGASSSIGSRYVGQSGPDGNTLLIIANTFASTPAIMRSVGYDPVKDFVGVTMLARLPMVLVVPAGSSYRTLGDLVTDARANPGKLSYAHGGSGSTTRFAAARLTNQFHLQMEPIPYKGAGDAGIDLMAGRVAMMFDQMSSSLPHITSGRMRALGITSSRRSDVLPDVPTFEEAGAKDFEDYTWIGLVAPAAVSKARILRLNLAVKAILASQEVREQLTNRGLEVLDSTPEAFTAYIKNEVVRLNKLARDARIEME